MNFLKFVGAVVLVGAAVWAVTVIAGKRIIATPDGARIILDVEQHTYASPTCAVAGNTERDLILRDAPRQPTFQAFAVVKTWVMCAKNKGRMVTGGLIASAQTQMGSCKSKRSGRGYLVKPAVGPMMVSGVGSSHL